MAKPSEAAEELGFEAALDRLEGLVERLEGGELPLEDALLAFEEGVALTRRCAGQLERAERRIETLTREGDRLVERPLAENAPDEGA
jgi:exodeoxyribonuclease VII small subunit